MWNQFVNVCHFRTQFLLILSEFLKNCLEHRVVLAFEKSTCFPPNQFSSMTWLFFIPHVVFKIEKNIFPLGYFHPFYKLHLAHSASKSHFLTMTFQFSIFSCVFFLKVILESQEIMKIILYLCQNIIWNVNPTQKLTFVFFRYGSYHVWVFWRHHNCFLHYTDCLGCWSVWCHLLPYNHNQEILVEIFLSLSLFILRLPL